MPLYQYSALTEKGVLLQGEDVAVSEQELKDRLAARGMLIQGIRGPGLRRQLFAASQVKPADFALFNQELLALIRAGLTIPDALALAAARPGAPLLEAGLQKVLADVRAGLALSVACSRQPEIFEPLYVTSVKTGEAAGNLAGVLSQYQAYLRQRLDLRAKMTQAAAYPLFLLVTLFVVLGILFIYVLPRFVALYQDFDAQLPWATRVLTAVVDGLPMYAPAAFVLLLIGGVAMRAWIKTPSGQLRWHQIRERLPLLGEFERGVNAAQLARTLATLLSTGTPLTEALRTTAGSLPSRALRQRLEQAIQNVMQGFSFAEAARKAAVLPPAAVKMIEVGEATGRLDSMLSEIALLHEEQVAARLQRLMLLIEPILMLLIGALVGGIIVVMYLPIFHLADVIR
jgi:type IV pilus assembly protein PilC